MRRRKQRFQNFTTIRLSKHKRCSAHKREVMGGHALSMELRCKNWGYKIIICFCFLFLSTRAISWFKEESRIENKARTVEKWCSVKNMQLRSIFCLFTFCVASLVNRMASRQWIMYIRLCLFIWVQHDVFRKSKTCDMFIGIHNEHLS